MKSFTDSDIKQLKDDAKICEELHRDDMNLLLWKLDALLHRLEAAEKALIQCDCKGGPERCAYMRWLKAAGKLSDSEDSKEGEDE